MCNREVAVQFCICGSLPLLCPYCKGLHQSKPDFHFSLPLKALDSVTSKRQQSFKVHLLSLVNSHEKLKENLGILRDCRSVIEATYEDIHRELEQAKVNLLGKLEEWDTALSQQIELTIQETSENAYRDDYQPSTHLAALVWTHCKQNSSDPIEVFSHVLKATDDRLRDPVDIAFKSGSGELGMDYESGGRQMAKEIELLKEQVAKSEKKAKEFGKRCAELEAEVAIWAKTESSSRKATETPKVDPVPVKAPAKADSDSVETLKDTNPSPVNSAPPPVQAPANTTRLAPQPQAAPQVYAQAAPQFYPQAGPQPYVQAGPQPYAQAGPQPYAQAGPQPYAQAGQYPPPGQIGPPQYAQAGPYQYPQAGQYAPPPGYAQAAPTQYAQPGDPYPQPPQAYAQAAPAGRNSLPANAQAGRQSQELARGHSSGEFPPKTDKSRTLYSRFFGK